MTKIRKAAIITGASAALVLVPTGIALAAGNGGPNPASPGPGVSSYTGDQVRQQLRLHDGTGTGDQVRQQLRLQDGTCDQTPANSAAINGHASGPVDGTGPQVAVRPLDGTGNQWGGPAR